MRQYLLYLLQIYTFLLVFLYFFFMSLLCLVVSSLGFNLRFSVIIVSYIFASRVSFVRTSIARTYVTYGPGMMHPVYRSQSSTWRRCVMSTEWHSVSASCVTE